MNEHIDEVRSEELDAIRDEMERYFYAEFKPLAIAKCICCSQKSMLFKQDDYISMECKECAIDRLVDDYLENI